MLPRNCLLALVLLLSGVSHAEDVESIRHRLTICNDTGMNAKVAIVQGFDFANPDEVRADGWYDVHAYTCMPLGMRQANVAIYAYSAEQGQMTVYGQNNKADGGGRDNRVCVKSDRFSLKGKELSSCPESETRLFNPYVLDDKSAVLRLTSY